MVEGKIGVSDQPTPYKKFSAASMPSAPSVTRLSSAGISPRPSEDRKGRAKSRGSGSNSCGEWSSCKRESQSGRPNAYLPVSPISVPGSAPPKPAVGQAGYSCETLLVNDSTFLTFLLMHLRKTWLGARNERSLKGCKSQRIASYVGRALSAECTQA